MRRVLKHLPDWYAPPIEFAWRTGRRIGEVKALTWAQVDFAAGTVRLEPGTAKNREGRIFPFAASPMLAALLREQLERTQAWQREHGQVVSWVFWRLDARLGACPSIRQSSGVHRGRCGRCGHEDLPPVST